MDWIGLPGITLFVLALIWFGDELGELTGLTSRGYISQKSPGCFVKLIGWVLLITLIGV